jgi:general L-amino acid transport system substrate-binding protein
VRQKFFLALLCLVVAGHAAFAQQTLATVRAAGKLTCGVVTEDAEYNTEDDHGSRGDFDIELCKAVAIAALGENARSTVISFLDDVTAMDALRTGKVDVIASLSKDFSHTAKAKLGMTEPVLYDGVGFLVPLSAHIAHAHELTHKKVCFLAETEVETSLHTWFTNKHLDLLPFPFQEEGEMEAAYITNNCTALAGDLTRLAITRMSFGSRAKEYILLPEVVAQDPMAMAYRQDDAAWGHLVDWTVQVLLHGESNGLTQANVLSKQKDPDLARMMGTTHEMGVPLGLHETWVAEVLHAAGNYGEIYERTLGKHSERQIPRGLNKLWTDGGLLYPLPLK